jgi:hypothetical protein
MNTRHIVQVSLFLSNVHKALRGPMSPGHVQLRALWSKGSFSLRPDIGIERVRRLFYGQFVSHLYGFEQLSGCSARVFLGSSIFRQFNNQQAASRFFTSSRIALSAV